MSLTILSWPPLSRRRSSAWRAGCTERKSFECRINLPRSAKIDAPGCVNAAEVMSNSSNKIHQTWCTDFSQSLYCIKWHICSAMKCCYISLKYGKPLINWSDLIFWVKLSPIGTGRRGIWCGMSGPSLKGEREMSFLQWRRNALIKCVCVQSMFVTFSAKVCNPSSGQSANLSCEEDHWSRRYSQWGMSIFEIPDTTERNKILGDKRNCALGFVNCFLRVPLAYLGSMAQGNRAGASMDLWENSYR